MKHVDRLAFDAALKDLWDNEDADPDAIFARQGLMVIAVSPKRQPTSERGIVNRFVDDLIECVDHPNVKERVNGPQYAAIAVDEIRSFAEDYFDE